MVVARLASGSVLLVYWVFLTIAVSRQKSMRRLVHAILSLAGIAWLLLAPVSEDDFSRIASLSDAVVFSLVWWIGPACGMLGLFYRNFEIIYAACEGALKPQRASSLVWVVGFIICAGMLFATTLYASLAYLSVTSG